MCIGYEMQGYLLMDTFQRQPVIAMPSSQCYRPLVSDRSKAEAPAVAHPPSVPMPFKIYKHLRILDDPKQLLPCTAFTMAPEEIGGRVLLLSLASRSPSHLEVNEGGMH